MLGGKASSLKKIIQFSSLTECSAAAWGLPGEALAARKAGVQGGNLGHEESVDAVQDGREVWKLQLLRLLQSGVEVLEEQPEGAFPSSDNPQPGEPKAPQYGLCPAAGES